MSRIVAGSARGRRLETPDGGGTRPTSDRVREAFFSVLASWNGTADAGAEHQFAGLGFLDLYAGSGAMGLEAASRGAARVDLVESDARAAEVIRRNIEVSGLRARVRAAKVETLVATPPAGEAFDVVWLDPPYALGEDQLDGVLASVLGNGWVRRDGVIVVERSGRGRAPALAGAETWSRSYGDTTLHWFAPEEGPGGEGPGGDASGANGADRDQAERAAGNLAEAGEAGR